MNAYELADSLRTIGAMPSYEVQIFLMKTATMLRQQAKRIEELEAMYWKEVYRNIPPHKELSDEEINQIWRKVLADSLSLDGLQNKTTVDIEFAREIIKASRGEK